MSELNFKKAKMAVYNYVYMYMYYSIYEFSWVLKYATPIINAMHII